MKRSLRLLFGIALALGLVGIGALLVNLPSLLHSGRFLKPGLGSELVLVGQGSVRPDSIPLDSARAIAALEQVADPELGFSIVALDLVKSLRMDSLNGISLRMLLTTPECPYSQVLGELALGALQTLPGAGRIEVRLDPTGLWDPSCLTGAARQELDRVRRNDTVPGR